MNKKIIYSIVITIFLSILISIFYIVRYRDLFRTSDPGESYFRLQESALDGFLSGSDQKIVNEIISTFMIKNKEYYTEYDSFDNGIRPRLYWNKKLEYNYYKDIHKKLLTELVSMDSFVSLVEGKIHPLLSSKNMYTLQEQDINALSLVYLYATDLCYKGKVEQCGSLFVDLLQFIQSQKYNNTNKLYMIEAYIIESIEFLYSENNIIYGPIIKKIRDNVVYTSVDMEYPEKNNQYKKWLYASLDDFLQRTSVKGIDVLLFKSLVREFFYNGYTIDKPTVLHKDYKTIDLFEFYIRNLNYTIEWFKKHELNFYRMISKVK